MLALTLVGALRLQAQVSVELVLDQNQFLRDESLPIKVRITNRSGQALHLGQDADWLTFNIQGRDALAAARTGRPPVEEAFTLEAAQVATRRVDLMPYFDLSEPGSYRVSATIRIREWNEEFTSGGKDFVIIRGTTIWEQEFGMPTESGAPEVRRYVLQQAPAQNRLVLYVRITDAGERRVFKVVPIGTLVSFSRPEVQLDRQSRLHLLFQTGARAFLYTLVDPSGLILLRQTYDYTQTRPMLKGDEQGEISVVGGARRLTAGDIPSEPPPAPPPPPSPATNEVPTPKS